MIKPFSSPCRTCGFNRRRFLTSCAACVGSAGLWGGTGWMQASPSQGKPRIRIVYALHGAQQKSPDWPNQGFDFDPVMRRINTELNNRCPGFEFVTAQASGEEAARKILEADQAAGRIDGYVVYQMNCWNRVVQVFAGSGKPVLYADFQFGGSGGFLVYNAAFLRGPNPNVGYVASSELKDVAEAVKCFQVVKDGGNPSDFVAATTRTRLRRTPRAGRAKWAPDPVETLPIGEVVERLKGSKILAVRGQESGPAGDADARCCPARKPNTMPFAMVAPPPG